MDIYIYNAGPLFSEADQKQRRLEGQLLRDAVKDRGFVANPIELPFATNEPIQSKEIFLKDTSHIDQANVFFFDLAGNDSGTLVELGMAIEKLRQGKKIYVYPIFSDLRLLRNQASGVESPVGYNSFVIGSLTAHNIVIFDSFASAFQSFLRDFNLQ
jgi:nucleoside 2-deoxyribosyltransferase